MKFNDMIDLHRDELHYKIGFDLGATSIGWCIVLLNDEDKPYKIYRSGVYLFPAGIMDMNSSNEKTPTSEKREKRGIRRQIGRKKQRLNYLLRALNEIGFIDHSFNFTQHISHGDNPYQLRAEGLTNELEKNELVRVFYHIAKRRGFQSNARDRIIKDKSKIYVGQKNDTIGIKYIDEAIESGYATTLGEYLYKLSEERSDTVGKLEPKTYKGEVRLRNRYTLREHYKNEFDTLWEQQKVLHSASGSEAADLFTADNRKKIFEAIFYQRKMQSMKHLLKECELLPHKKVICKADPIFQEYRLRSQLNNLVIFHDYDGELTKERCKGLFDALYNDLKHKGKYTNEDIKKVTAAYLEIERDLISTNYENEKFSGATTFAAINSHIKNSVFVENNINRIYELYKTSTSDEWLSKKLQSEFSLDAELSDKVAAIQLESEYAAYSKAAIKAILPALRKGENLHYSILAAQQSGQLKTTKYHFFRGQKTSDSEYLPFPTSTNNPLVNITLQSLRNLYNELVYLHGPPSEVKIELARNIQMGKKSRDNKLKIDRYNRDRNNEVKLALANFGRTINSDNITKYKLWQDSHIQGVPKCIYCNCNINEKLLWAGTHIDHIKPRRTHDNSYGNKVLCCSDCNSDKGDRLPFEAWGDDKDRMSQIKSRAKTMFLNSSQSNICTGPQKAKYYNLNKTKLIDEDVSAKHLLHSTSYVSRMAIKEFERIGVKTQVISGRVVSRLRHIWKLNSILSNDGHKNRGDNRHHAIDAAVVAVANTGHIATITKWLNTPKDVNKSQYNKDVSKYFWVYRKPWDDFDVELETSVKNILIYYKPSNKISDALHEGTFYSWRKKPDGEYARNAKGAPQLSKRITPKDIEDLKKVVGNGEDNTLIVDKGIFRAIKREVEKNGLNLSNVTKKQLVDIFAEGIKLTDDPKNQQAIHKFRIYLTKTIANPIELYPDSGKWVKKTGNMAIGIYQIIDKNKRTYKAIQSMDVNKYIKEEGFDEYFKSIAETSEEYLFHIRKGTTVCLGGLPEKFDKYDFSTYNTLSELRAAQMRKGLARVTTWKSDKGEIKFMDLLYNATDKHSKIEGSFTYNSMPAGSHLPTITFSGIYV